MNQNDLKEVNLHFFEQLLNSVKQTGHEVTATQKQQLELLSLASPYATQQLIRQPMIYVDWLALVAQKKAFDVSAIVLRDIDFANEREIKQKLRVFRHYYLCHIILNDVCLNLSVETILKQISQLAFKLITVALSVASEFFEARFGVPISSNGDVQRLMVLAMGKLGGGELNFSSDIDLVLVYGEDGTLNEKSELSYREFYTRVGRLFTQLLNDTTEHGFVYRVDLRLRPWGDSGPTVINLSGLENYYQLHGRDWERYALVKATVLTGNENDKIQLKKVIEPFVYRKYHDFNVFSGLGSLKQQIDREARKKQQSLNIKLCAGGIREIEFCIQALQILQGGRHKQLQEPSILAMFELAESETFYSTAELSTLKKSYILLRLVENRIQMQYDQQTHNLPKDEEGQARLLSALPYKHWEDLELELETARLQVNAIFKQLFIEQIHDKESNDFFSYDKSDWLEYCEQINFVQSEPVARHLGIFFKERIILAMTRKGKERLNELLPGFLLLIQTYEYPLKLLHLLTELLLAIARRSIYLEMLSMHKPLLQKLIDLFAKSQWLAEELIRFPILLESVLITDSSDVYDKEGLSYLLGQELKQVAGDLELELDVLRVFKRQQLFQIALQEIEGRIEALEASAYLSDLAEIVLQASYELNLAALERQYGQPQFEYNNEIVQAKFAIIAYGKLGGKELHYTSDLDVIFLHNSKGNQQKTNGNQSIDNARFFMRLAQKITQTISLLTSSGRAYEIDARLRPNGASGFLVSSLDAFATYQKEKAWVWEHQALVRARFVAGDASIKYEFNEIKCSILSTIEQQGLAQSVVEMRQKMLSSVKKRSAFNLKKSKGGMIDIEFIVQYLVLLNANKLSSLCQYSANIALLKHLHQNNCLNEAFLVLIDIYKVQHQQLHLQVLQRDTYLAADEQLSEHIATVNQLWQQCFELD